MTKQEKIEEFIQKHCSSCLNKNGYQCNIILDKSGKAKCSEEKIKKVK